MSPVCSVIIPAHNESGVIRRCLDSLLRHASKGEFEIIVVANGCTDDTAASARRAAALLDAPVSVIETSIPSKSNALNLGDSVARAFPRIYLDADIVLSSDAARRLATALQDQPGQPPAASARLVVDVAGASWPVRSFYRVWAMLPYTCLALGGGMYALSAAGRARFSRFPSVTADDAFVRGHFAPHERPCVADCTFTVTAPRTLRGLLKIKTRSRRGNLELQSALKDLPHAERFTNRSALQHLALRPARWVDLLVYSFVTSYVRVAAFYKHCRGRHAQWERDETSRQPLAAPRWKEIR
jgi:glycosyltransferase involved in cell wall biosynthesis